jgi:hypothetical protein
MLGILVEKFWADLFDNFSGFFIFEKSPISFNKLSNPILSIDSLSIAQKVFSFKPLLE